MAPVSDAAARVVAPAAAAIEWGRKQRSDRAAGGVSAAYRAMADDAVAAREAVRREGSLLLLAFHNPLLVRITPAAGAGGAGAGGAAMRLAFPPTAPSGHLTINLHGQHADAAVALLRHSLLPWLGAAATPAAATVTLVTGVGHGAAPMKAAVLAQLPRGAVVAGGRYVVGDTVTTKRGAAGVVLKRR